MLRFRSLPAAILPCILFVLIPSVGLAKDFKILTSFYPLYVSALNVAGGIPGVQVLNLTRPTTGCLHDYQLTTEDMTRLAGANVLIINGLGMEGFLEKALKQAPKLKTIEASRGIKPIRDRNGEENAHVFVSIGNTTQQVKNIAEALAQADPAHAAAYRNNAAEYVKRLNHLHDRMHRELDFARGRKIITLHEAFPYFAQELGLQIAGVVEREPGTEPSAGELAQTIRMIRKEKVHAIFSEPQYSAKAAETIAREAKVPLYSLDPAVTGPESPKEVRDAYLRAMESNLEILKKALK